jgi:uncharacterized protein
MRIIIDIGHPAHVHIFKYFAAEMQSKGHRILFTVREKEFEIELLKQHGFEYVSFGKHRKNNLSKIIGLFIFSYKLLMVSVSFRPDIYFSHGSIYAAWTSRVYRKPHVSLEDTGNWEQVILYRPFTKAIVTSLSFPMHYGKKQIYYDGYHETAYLHPKYFKPDSSIYNTLKLNEDQPYIIIRFVSWTATHDIGKSGLSLSDKLKLVNELNQHSTIFITSENELPKELQKYKMIIPPDRIHDALYFAQLYIGEGVTMASECAHLGTPAIYINTLQRGYTSEQEKNYNLVFNFSSISGVVSKAIDILSNKGSKEKFHERSKKMLGDKIDVTSFFIWLIEQWPKSFQIMKDNPKYYLRFK